MQVEVRSHIKDNCASEMKGVKDEVMQAMKQNKDVLFNWSMVSANWESEEVSVLLDMIMELWVTMCGFSYAGGFIEQHKQKNKRNQKG